MADIFISYSSKDEQKANDICNRFENEGISCWIAPRDIEVGKEYGGEIIKGILDLHVKNHKIDCDSTYSVGNFYKNTGIEEPTYKFDIKPQIDGVKKGDSRNLPLEDCSIECLMFDPPFLATTGKSLEKDDGNNIINKRYKIS